MITAEEKQLLLQYAASLLEEQCGGKPVPDTLLSEVKALPLCREKRGVFVSLHKGGMLRGCIGFIEPVTTLFDALSQNVYNAGFRDPRFPPLASEELHDIVMEISILTPPEEISSYEEFNVGEEGIILRKGAAQAVFLPQVAPEQGWGRDETLMHLSLKAGLSGDGWREGCCFLTFRAEHFSSTFKELREGIEKEA